MMFCFHPHMARFGGQRSRDFVHASICGLHHASHSFLVLVDHQIGLYEGHRFCFKDEKVCLYRGTLCAANKIMQTLSIKPLGLPH